MASPENVYLRFIKSAVNWASETMNKGFSNQIWYPYNCHQFLPSKNVKDEKQMQEFKMPFPGTNSLIGHTMAGLPLCHHLFPFNPIILFTTFTKKTRIRLKWLHGLILVPFYSY